MRQREAVGGTDAAPRGLLWQEAPWLLFISRISLGGVEGTKFGVRWPRFAFFTCLLAFQPVGKKLLLESVEFD